MRFESWHFLLLVVPLVALIYARRKGRDAPPTMRYSDLSITAGAKSGRARLGGLPFWLRIAALSLLIVAAARPQKGLTSREVISEGVDIVLCLDRSGSMMGIDPVGREVDPEKTRLNVAKQVMKDFIKGRRNDRIGLVVFAGRAYTQCPLTLDYGVLLTFLESVGFAERDKNTAVGDALGTAVNHLKDSNAKSKVVILVTDGESNSGIIDPVTAARLAAKYDIRVYTVGVGSRNGAVVVMKDFFGSRLVPQEWGLDENTLRQVSDITKAKYFPAGSPDEMKVVFERIDKMEKTELKIASYTDFSERFAPWAAFALLILLVETALKTGYLRSIP